MRGGRRGRTPTAGRRRRSTRTPGGWRWRAPSTRTRRVPPPRAPPRGRRAARHAATGTRAPPAAPVAPARRGRPGPAARATTCAAAGWPTPCRRRSSRPRAARAPSSRRRSSIRWRRRAARATGRGSSSRPATHRAGDDHGSRREEPLEDPQPLPGEVDVLATLHPPHQPTGEEEGRQEEEHVDATRDPPEPHVVGHDQQHRERAQPLDVPAEGRREATAREQHRAPT